MNNSTALLPELDDGLLCSLDVISKTGAPRLAGKTAATAPPVHRRMENLLRNSPDFLDKIDDNGMTVGGTVPDRDVRGLRKSI